MLGNIAKKLRLMGFDSEYYSDKSDDDILKIIQTQNRILVTKDEELSSRAKKNHGQVILLTKNNESEQFLEIKKHLNIENFSIDVNVTRCTLCNGKLISINKNEILDQIPTKIQDNQEKFWKCKECKKIYWEGTHIMHLQNFIRSLNE